MIKHIEREIYEVAAKVVDASGAYNNLSGTIGGTAYSFPMSVDSHQNGDDLEKTKNKAYAAFDAAGTLGYTAAANGRPLTIVTLTRISDSRQIERKLIGKMPPIDQEVPDPEPEEETPEEPEQNGGE